MSIKAYDWNAAPEFRNRSSELARLERWWTDSAREPLSMWGRRRVGKSWLFRRLAHQKPAVILVADKVSLGLQLDRMAVELEPVLGVRPRLDSIGDLFTTLYRLAKDTKALVVIDEFPYLLGTSSTEQAANMSTISAVMERERDSSRIKLLLAGSTITTMQDLMKEQNPLHGRLVPFQVRPLDFGHARQLMGERRTDQGVAQELLHFAVAGGMPRYLTALRGTDLLRDVIEVVIDPSGALFNEPRNLLATELREPAMYFSILASLATRPARTSEIADNLRLEPRDLTVYLQTLETLQLVTRYEPVGVKAGSRGGVRWRCDDDFIRFWFRFVQPMQAELEAGADPRAVMERRVKPALPEHVSLTFERVFDDWMRTRYCELAPQVGSWWGNALNSLRKSRQRTSEEIDSVVLDGKNVAAVGEAKWTNKQMSAEVLTDLDNFKIPALAQAGLTVSGVDIVLASKSGFTQGLRSQAAKRGNVRLLSAEELLGAW